ncbi:MAG: restriction endonuclease [Burkholderiales bacterium]|nr:restriction endonuclease [Burkholderiales bacterium]
MRLRMHENSLFAILLRAPWWVSALVTAGIFAAARALLPAKYEAFAFFLALPTGVIALVAGWRQVRAPSAASVDAAIGRLRAMSWESFAAALDEGFRRDGYAVTRGRGAADFELEKGGRIELAAAKRWKASRTGIEPLRELHAAGEAREAACLYLCAGEITGAARAFAAQKNIRLVEGPELARLAEAGARLRTASARAFCGIRRRDRRRSRRG